MKKCISCGMPMEKKEDFALGDISKDYCCYCCHTDGTMQSYEEKLSSLKDYVMRTQGLDEKSAESAAKSMMAELPAWKSKCL